GGGLVVFVVADDRPVVVRADHLGGAEMPGGERGLPRPGNPDEQHQARRGNLEDAGGVCRLPLISVHLRGQTRTVVACGTISGAPCWTASASWSLSCSWAARSASIRAR